MSTLKCWICTLLAAFFCLSFVPKFAFADDIDRSKLNEQQTVEQLAKDLAGLHPVVVSVALTPKIADHVVAHGKQTLFNVGTSDAGTSHVVRFYTERAIYIVSVNVYESGKKALSIDYYLTNQRFTEYTHPADSVAEQLVMGTPKIHIENYFYDKNADGVLEMFGQYIKKVGSAYDGFTREERDLGTKAGVTSFTFDSDNVSEGAGWRKATDEEIADVRAEYAWRMEVIARQFGIQ